MHMGEFTVDIIGGIMCEIVWGQWESVTDAH